MLIWLTRQPGIETGRDDAKYLLLGRALRHFSYREFWRPGTPIHTEYPPGYPALLGIVGLVTGDRFDGFILVNILLSVAALAMLYRAASRTWSPAVGVIALAMLALNPYLVDRGGQIAAEPTYMFLTVTALVLLAGDAVSPRARVIAAALSIAAALTRSVGVALLAALLLHWVLERRWRLAIGYAVACALTVGAWLGFTILFAPRVVGESYVGDALTVSTDTGSHLPWLLERFFGHFATYTATTLPLVLQVPTIPGTIIDNILGAAIICGGLLAGMIVAWRQWRAMTLYLVVVMLLLMTWIWDSLRFFVPLLPLLACCLTLGVVWAFARFGPRTAVAAAAVLALMLGTTGAMVDAGTVSQFSTCVRGTTPPDATCLRRDQASFFAATQWIRAHLPADAVIVNAKPETLALYTGRRTMPVQISLARGQTLLSAMAHDGADWLLLGSVSGWEVGDLQDRLLKECGGLRVAARFPPRTLLFQRNPEPAAADSSGCAAMAEYRRLNLGRDFERDP